MLFSSNSGTWVFNKSRTSIFWFFVSSKNSIMEIKKVNNELENKIIDIDMMMEHISSTEDEYIECYSN